MTVLMQQDMNFNPTSSGLLDIAKRVNNVLDGMAAVGVNILQQVMRIAEEKSIVDCRLSTSEVASLNKRNYYSHSITGNFNDSNLITPNIYNAVADGNDRHIETKEKAEAGVKLYKDTSEAVSKSFELMDGLGAKFGKLEPTIEKLRKGVGLYNGAMTILENVSETGVFGEGGKKAIESIGSAVNYGVIAGELLGGPVGWAVGLGTLAISFMSTDEPKHRSLLSGMHELANQNAISSFYNADKESFYEHEAKEQKQLFNKDSIDASNKQLRENAINYIHAKDNLSTKPLIAVGLMGQGDQNPIKGVLAGTLDAENAIRPGGIAGQEAKYMLEMLPKELHKVGEARGMDNFYYLADRAKALSDQFLTKGVDIQKQTMAIINNEKNKLAGEAKVIRGESASQGRSGYLSNSGQQGTGHTINININKPMVEHFTINAKEVKEGYTQLEHMVEESLLRILNSANAIH